MRSLQKEKHLCHPKEYLPSERPTNNSWRNLLTNRKHQLYKIKSKKYTFIHFYLLFLFKKSQIQISNVYGEFEAESISRSARAASRSSSCILLQWVLLSIGFCYFLLGANVLTRSWWSMISHRAFPLSGGALTFCGLRGWRKDGSRLRLSAVARRLVKYVSPLDRVYWRNYWPHKWQQMNSICFFSKWSINHTQSDIWT